MPRSNLNKKNMSLGWKELNEYSKLPLEEKITKSHELIKKKLKKHNKPVICWSGGKDSTVMLHLILQHFSNIPVIHINTGVLFPETTKFIDKLAKAWDLNLIISKPVENENFWITVKKYGWPIFSKNIASNVERAIRTGNIRSQMSFLEKILAENNICISIKCAENILEKPTKKVEQSLGADLKIIGLRALESRVRARLWVDYGEYYYVKRYFKRNSGIWKLNPLSIWTDKDIWNYHKKYSIPHYELYDMGYPRNGCWTCAMAIRSGQLERLKQNHPKLFSYLLSTNMGVELAKAKQALLNSKKKVSLQMGFFDAIDPYLPKI